MAMNAQEYLITEALSEAQTRQGRVTSLSFALTEFNDEGLRILCSNCPEIERLYLIRTPVTDEGMKWLGQISSLRELDLSGTAVTPDGLAELSKLKLKELSLSLSSATPNGFAAIGQMSALTSLSISHQYNDPFIHYHRAEGSPVDSNDLAHLARLTGLEKLALRGVPLQNEDLSWLTSLSELRSLSLNNTHAKSAPLTQLAGLRKIESLYLSNTDLDDRLLELLVGALPIKELGIANTKVTSAGALHLAQHSKLEAIFAEEVAWSEDACRALLNMPTLQDAELNIDGIDHEFLETICPPHVSLHP